MDTRIYHGWTPKPSRSKTKLQLGAESLAAAIFGEQTTQSNSLFDCMSSAFI